jgi:hypothetical protein
MPEFMVEPDGGEKRRHGHPQPTRAAAKIDKFRFEIAGGNGFGIAEPRSRALTAIATLFSVSGAYSGKEPALGLSLIVRFAPRGGGV